MTLTAPSGIDTFSAGAPARIRQIQAQMAALAGPRRTTATSSAQFASALDAASGVDDSAGDASGDRVVSEAKKYLGVPYLWGGTDPAKGLDCSGFTQLVFKNLGYSIPRTSQDQANVGTAVPSLAEAKPGDLIVLDGGGHVGIYVGDGKMIHSPHTGSNVQISDVWNSVTAIRRVVPNSATGATTAARGITASTGLNGDRVRADVPYANLFNAAGAKHGVSPTLLAAMAKTESNFNPKAGSSAGAQGLMQFMPGTAKSYDIDPWDPAQAIDGAARYMKSSLGQFGGDVDKAIASYNAGAGAVQRFGGVPPYGETQNYVRLVKQRIGEMT
jgi:cell wall-associated NlpC family hydrolase